MDPIRLSLDEWIQSVSLLGEEKWWKLAQKIPIEHYLQLHEPAISWILYCSAQFADEETFEKLLNSYFKAKMDEKSAIGASLFLQEVLRNFSAKFISARGAEFVRLINESGAKAPQKAAMFRLLGERLIEREPAEDKLKLLNEAWKFIMRLQEPKNYMECAEIWLEYCCRYFTAHEINTLLGDIVAHATPDRTFEGNMPRQKGLSFSSLHQEAVDHFLPFS